MSSTGAVYLSAHILAFALYICSGRSCDDLPVALLLQLHGLISWSTHLKVENNGEVAVTVIPSPAKVNTVVYAFLNRFVLPDS